MSNALGISPSTMINRIADRSGTPAEAQLGRVAALRAQLMRAVDDEQAKAANLQPTEDVPAVALTSGAVVDRLI